MAFKQILDELPDIDNGNHGLPRGDHVVDGWTTSLAEATSKTDLDAVLEKHGRHIPMPKRVRSSSS